MAIKKCWVVECIDSGPLMDEHGNAVEFKTERAALKKARSMVADDGQEEVLVYVLTHVVSRPITPVEVERVI